MSDRPDDDFLVALRETPRPEFAAQLAARLGPATDGRQSPRPRNRHGRSISAVVIAAILLMAVSIGLLLLPRRMPQESAQQVLQRVAAVNVNDLGVQTWHLRIESDIYDTPSTPAKRPIVITSEWWAASPNRWRVDFRVSAPPFLAHTDQLSGSVSDGMTEWSYSPTPSGYEVQIGALPPGATAPPLKTISLPSGDLRAGQAVGGGNTAPATPTSGQAFLACYPRATLNGTATVAGRETYVIDLGPDVCSPGTRTVAGTTVPQPTVPPGQQGRQTVWVDKQWSVLLKLENRNPDGSLRIHTEATIFAVNQSVADGVFVFAPPPEVTGAHTADLRPQPYRPPASAPSCQGCTSPGVFYHQDASTTATRSSA